MFVEFSPQTRIEGEIQQMPPDYEVTELWEVLAGKRMGRRSPQSITVFDSVGFAIEDFSALRLVHDLTMDRGRTLDVVPDLADPKDLFGELIGAELVRSPEPV